MSKSPKKVEQKASVGFGATGTSSITSTGTMTDVVSTTTIVGSEAQLDSVLVKTVNDTISQTTEVFCAPPSGSKYEILAACIPAFNRMLEFWRSLRLKATSDLEKREFDFMFGSLDKLKDVVSDWEVAKLYRSGKISAGQYKTFCKNIGKEDLIDSVSALEAMRTAASLEEDVTYDGLSLPPSNPKDGLVPVEPEVINLLKKITTFKSLGTSPLIKKISLNLEDVLKKDDTNMIKTILKAGHLSGEILITPYVIVIGTKSEATGCFYSDSSDIVISVMPQEKECINRKSIFMANSMVHELTHKLMKFLFNNYADPYRVSDKVAKSGLDEVIIDLEKDDLFKDHPLFKVYKENTRPQEIIAIYFQGKVIEILRGLDIGKLFFTHSDGLEKWIAKHLTPVLEVFFELFEAIDSHFSETPGLITGHVLDYSGFDQEILGEVMS